MSLRPRSIFGRNIQVNDFRLALPIDAPRIRFLFVGLAICYRLPSSVCCLPDSAELLDLPLLGRSVDFHHINTRALTGAPKKSPRCLQTSRAGTTFGRGMLALAMTADTKLSAVIPIQPLGSVRCRRTPCRLGVSRKEELIRYSF